MINIESDYLQHFDDILRTHLDTHKHLMALAANGGDQSKLYSSLATDVFISALDKILSLFFISLYIIEKTGHWKGTNTKSLKEVLSKMKSNKLQSTKESIFSKIRNAASALSINPTDRSAKKERSLANTELNNWIRWGSRLEPGLIQCPAGLAAKINALKDLKLRRRRDKDMNLINKRAFSIFTRLRRDRNRATHGVRIEFRYTTYAQDTDASHVAYPVPDCFKIRSFLPESSQSTSSIAWDKLARLVGIMKLFLSRNSLEAAHQKLVTAARKLKPITHRELYDPNCKWKPRQLLYENLTRIGIQLCKLFDSDKRNKKSN
jgi:hypothetical protein